MIIADMLQRYVLEVFPTRRRSKVEAFYVKKILADPFAQEDLSTIPTSVIATYRDRVIAKHGPRCARYHLQILSLITSKALSDWDLKRSSNPFFLVKKPPQGPFRERRLSPEEYRRLIDACSSGKTIYLLPMVKLAIATAMRGGELRGLKWSQVHWHQRHADIHGKTGRRKVPLSKEALETLRELHRLSGGLSCGRVFPITQAQFRKAWEAVRKKAGLVDFHFHDLRHESISRYMERGDLTLQEVATISGHKTLNMLWRYTHLQTSVLANKL